MRKIAALPHPSSFESISSDLCFVDQNVTVPPHPPRPYNHSHNLLKNIFTWLALRKREKKKKRWRHRAAKARKHAFLLNNGQLDDVNHSASWYQASSLIVAVRNLSLARDSHQAGPRPVRFPRATSGTAYALRAIQNADPEIDKLIKDALKNGDAVLSHDPPSIASRKRSLPLEHVNSADQDFPLVLRFP